MAEDEKRKEENEIFKNEILEAAKEVREPKGIEMKRGGYERVKVVQVTRQEVTGGVKLKVETLKL